MRFLVLNRRQFSTLRILKFAQIAARLPASQRLKMLVALTVKLVPTLGTNCDGFAIAPLGFRVEVVGRGAPQRRPVLIYALIVSFSLVNEWKHAAFTVRIAAKCFSFENLFKFLHSYLKKERKAIKKSKYTIARLRNNCVSKIDHANEWQLLKAIRICVPASSLIIFSKKF